MAPLQINLKFEPKGIAEALKIAIDSITSVRRRKEELKTLRDELPHSQETNRMRAIQEEHEKLLHRSSNLTVDDTSFVKDFLKTLANAGVDISHDIYRHQLRTYIQYWSNYINDKEGNFPIIKLHPFDESKIQEELVKDIEQDEALLRLQEESLSLEKQKLELLQERLEMERNLLEIAIEAAEKVIDTLQPDADQQTKAMLIQTLLPSLIELSNGKGLQLTLTASQSNE